MAWSAQARQAAAIARKRAIYSSAPVHKGSRLITRDMMAKMIREVRHRHGPLSESLVSKGMKLFTTHWKSA